MTVDSTELRPTVPRSRRRLHRRQVVVVACALGLVAAACSSSDGKDTATKGTTGDAVRQRELPPCPLDALTNYDASAGPIEVNLWHFFGAKPEEALKTLATNYNASQNKVKVNVENQGTSPDELWKKYTAGIKNNQLPDIAIMDDTVTVQMADSNTVLPAQSCINAGNVDMSDFVEPAQAYYRLGGDLYPASLNLSSALLYYNVNHFTRAGLDPKSSPKTLAEVREFALKIKGAGVVDKPVVLKVGPPLIEMWLTGVGTPMVNNENGRGSGTTDAGVFNSPEALELYTWFQDMQRDGLLQVVPDTEGQVGQYTAMATQQASMTIETSTAATSIVAFLGGDRSIVEGVDAPTVDVSQLDITAAPVPGLRDPGQLQMGGGAWYMTTAGSSEKQAASWDFMQYVNSLDSQVTWTTVGSYLPYRISAATDPRVEANWDGTLSGSWLKLAFDELNTGVDPDFPGPLMGPYDQFRVAVRAGVEDLLFKDAQPQAVIDGTNDAATKALEQYQQENFG